MEITYLAFFFDMEPLISHWLPSPQLPQFLTSPSISILIRDAQALREERVRGGGSVFRKEPIRGWRGAWVLVSTPVTSSLVTLDFCRSHTSWGQS